MKVFNVVWAVVVFYMSNSMACSVLLNFYYYIQIVPLQRAFLIWVKRNIKILMYMVLLFDGIIFLFYSVISAADAFIITRVNGTLTEYRNDGLLQAVYVCFIIVQVHTLLCLCIISVSSFSTVHYLHRHIQTVTQGTIYSATMKIKSQIRVTITGIIQGVLFLLFATFTFFDSFTHYLSPHFYLSAWMKLTVSTIYISGTTVNLGIGQAIFRQKVADAWKAITSMCGVGMKTNDVRQPLKLLLWALTCCTITCLVSATLLSFTESKGVMLYFRKALYLLYISSVATSLTSSVWLNFFYYTQIVPAQRALSIWIKKNIKSVNYCIWLAERIFVVCDVMVVQYRTLGNYTFDGYSYNFTVYNDTIHLQSESKMLNDIVAYVVKTHMILCLCVMVMTSHCTLVYLCGHMRRMVANGQPVSHPRLRSQVRVTVTGILQGVLYLVCAVWTMCQFFSNGRPPMNIIHCTNFTVINLYMSGTTVALGVAESWKVSRISYVVALCSLSNSITSSVWLNFFYYTQIVPAQSALSIWIKNNVKSFIYCFWLVERIYTVFDFTTLYLSHSFNRFGSSNSTMDHDTVVSSLKWLKYLFLIVVWILKIHLFFCLCVMLMSSLCTVVYLCGHMRRMVANGQPVSHPRLRSQVRVTVTGILQGVLYLICAVWTMCQFFPFVFIDPTTHFTVINLYMSGTTVALGVGREQRTSGSEQLDAAENNRLNKEGETGAQSRRQDTGEVNQAAPEA
ncbi:hypothetical protein F7725_001849 [Dissostichus mawsoni]|uniref:Taste receptor type 2 n=1 Tax=Dissostichus mawsoni TaxID=36200 RepID=A0A7J5Y0Z2_DISMA|nr:hypothetical protein F7725_001849 [Dissostichus mawsoni]